jgi:DNA mismatch repair protein MutL
MFTNLQRVVRRTLLTYTPVPELFSPAQTSTGSQDGGFVQARWESQASSFPQEPANAEQSAAEEAVHKSEASRVPLLRLVGQVAAAFLVAEGPDGLYLIDQHAAHERVLFEKYLAQNENQVVSQSLLQPVTVTLPPGEARLLIEQLPVLNHLGFSVETFGPAMFQVRAVPEILAGMDPEAGLRVLVEDFEEDERPLQAQVERKLMARICKRAAVKAGKVLSSEEQRALLADLENCASPRTCPHGRPTMIHLSVDLLERQFGRQGAR